MLNAYFFLKKYVKIISGDEKMKFKEMNFPNKLTTIRMFCVPIMIVLFVLFMLNKTLNIPCDYMIIEDYSNSVSSSLSLCQIIMAVLFIFASITDYVDGHLARKHNIVSDYGKLMDPLADKLLVNTTIIFMLASGMYNVHNGAQVLAIIAIVFSIIVVIRDIFVDALRMQALKKDVVVSASIWGKLKTATLMPSVVILLLGSFNIALYLVGLCFMILGGIFAIVGGIKYYFCLAKYIGD